MRLRLLAALVVALWALPTAVAAGARPAGPAGPPPPEGRVQLVKRTDPTFDRFTDRPTAATRRWMNDTLFRSVVFTPYFDSRLSWHRTGWVYRDAYAVYDETLRRHPEWVLRSPAGRRLYIPWGCRGGSCPQFAGDFTHPGFRRKWIAEARATIAKGYKGIWVDDVNLELRAGDGSGRTVRPIDRRTGRPMTDTAWRAAMATFMEELRAALPASVEILHNSIWYAGGRARHDDPSVRRQIAAADYVNLERGINDSGFTGGDGEWSVDAFLRFVDGVHALGRAVVMESFAEDPAGREANLAAYFLVSSGRDGAAFGGITPATGWTGHRVDLGRALGGRRAWNGLLRRDFDRGVVLLAPPGAPMDAVELGAGLVDGEGKAVTRVRLPPGRGIVFRRAVQP